MAYASAVASRLFEAETVKWEMGLGSGLAGDNNSYDVCVDFLCDRQLTAEVIEQIEIAVNEEIRAGKLVSCEMVVKDELAAVANIRGAPKGKSFSLSVDNILFFIIFLCMQAWQRNLIHFGLSLLMA